MVVGSSWKSCRFLGVIFWAAIALLLINAVLLLSLGAESSSRLRESSPKLTRSPAKKLAVIVPTHAGDLAETIKSLEEWPTTCSSDTLHHVDLVIYKAEDFDEATETHVSVHIERERHVLCSGTSEAYLHLFTVF